MGADYLWTYYEIAAEPAEDIDWREIIDGLTAAVEGASDDAVIAVYEDRTGLTTDAEDARRRILAAVAMLEESRRDTAIDTIGGATIIHTGGMSWGDSPTEAFDEIELLWAARELADHRG